MLLGLNWESESGLEKSQRPYNLVISWSMTSDTGVGVGYKNVYPFLMQSVGPGLDKFQSFFPSQKQSASLDFY